MLVTYLGCVIAEFYRSLTTAVAIYFCIVNPNVRASWFSPEKHFISFLHPLVPFYACDLHRFSFLRSSFKLKMQYVTKFVALSSMFINSDVYHLVYVELFH